MIFRSDQSAKYIITLLLGIILSFACHHYFFQKAFVELELTTEKRAIFKIYWAKEGVLFSEKKMAQISIEPNNKKYSFWICDLGAVSRLRIDTSDFKPSRVTIKKIRIFQHGYQPIVFEKKSDFEQLKPLEGIEEVTLSEENGLTVTPAGIDPQLEFKLPHFDYSPDYFQEILFLSFCVLILIFLVATSESCWQDYKYVPYLLSVAFALVLVMAAISKNNVHPDEFVHVAAADYFQTHLLPPPIGSEEILNTYSPYGVSRLHSGEIAYLVAGKFMRILAPLHFSPYIALRLFNVTLFGVILLLALHNSVFRILVLPFLISPQIWYIFSYFNSEAFAIFIVFLICYQLVAEDSYFHGILEKGFDRRTLFLLPLLALLFASVLVLKENFYFFAVFAACYFVWRFFFLKSAFTKATISRLLLIVCAILLAAGFLKAPDLAVNGLHTSEKYLACREKFADKMFKPSTPLNHKFPTLQLRDRKISLKHILLIDRWGEKSFRTSFGVYGYTSVNASFAYYDLVRIVGLVLLAVIACWVLVRGGLANSSLLALTSIVAAALLAIALYRAWTVDFQAQGRYFLPFLGMFSILVYHIERNLKHSPFQLLLLAMFFLSLYNFVFVGLYDIAKWGAQF